MKILFVDDEPNILQGIERALYHRCDEWEVVTSDTGAEALELIDEEGDFDIVVSDMRMPSMSGLQLLTRLHAEYPHVLRVVLSGHANPTDMLDVVPMAHRCLAKPCPAGMLEAVIDELVGLRHIMTNPKLRNLASAARELPSLPSVHEELSVALQSPEHDVASVAAIAEKDPGVSAKLLQVVNAPFFGMKNSAKTVAGAVARLGVKTVCSIVLSMETFRDPPQFQSGAVNVKSIQERSLRAALLARDLSPDREQGGEAFIAALLQDVGILLLLASEHDDYAEARAGALDRSRAESGRDTHSQLGAYILALWGLPARIVEAVRYHHRPQDAEASSLVGVVHIASCLVDGREPNAAYIEGAGLSSLFARAVAMVG